jgi:hypothetical protein
MTMIEDLVDVLLASTLDLLWLEHLKDICSHLPFLAGWSGGLLLEGEDIIDESLFEFEFIDIHWKLFSSLLDDITGTRASFDGLHGFLDDLISDHLSLHDSKLLGNGCHFECTVEEAFADE